MHFNREETHRTLQTSTAKRQDKGKHNKNTQKIVFAALEQYKQSWKTWARDREIINQRQRNNKPETEKFK